MTNRRVWYDRCILQRGTEAEEFIGHHLCDESRRVLLIGGAGFDPRSTAVAECLSKATDRVRAIFIQEVRSAASKECSERAMANASTLQSLIADSKVEQVLIFASDGAVIGGRRAALLGSGVDLADLTDVVIDFSALSKGVAFPLTRLLLHRIETDYPATNLHVMVTDEVETDDQIASMSSDKVGPIHGFQGGLAAAQRNKSEMLWLPQLSFGERESLGRIYRYVGSPEVCPILPFPARDPHSADKLAADFMSEFQSVWRVDPRDVLYASEGNPLDLYRSILRLDSYRQRTFSEVGGSVTVLSPVGSKVTSIGAFMAAVDQDFPVVYVESLSYDVDFDQLDAQRTGRGDIVHIWLHGEAYAGIQGQ